MKKILIVDDSAFYRILLKEGLLKEAAQLSDSDLKFSEAEDSKSTLSQLKSELPDLVFLDVVMRDSEFEGVNILKNIRGLYPGLKVIMLTSVGQSSTIQKCNEYGALDYINKPFDNRELILTVKKHLE